MKKQFNLQYYLEHPETKVVTRDGRDVRILCTDLGSKDYPIAAICMSFYRHDDVIDTYTSKGKVASDPSIENIRDLFFDLPDPVKKKVPLTYDDLLERVKSGKTMWIIDDHDYVFNIVDFDDDAAYYVYGKGKEVSSALYEWLFGGCMKFADGTPCWKEVEK